MTLKRLKILLFLHLQHLPMRSRGHRARVAKWGGVNILHPRKTFIGEKVSFDTNYPEDIIIEEGVRITIGCVLITHFVESKTGTYLSIRIAWSDKEISSNFAVVNQHTESYDIKYTA